MENELDLQSILSQDNPDGDVFLGASAPEAVTVEATQPETQAETAADTTTATDATTATEANPYPDSSPQHRAFERQREDLLARAEAEKDAAVLRAIADRDAQWAASQRQTQQQEQEPAPDPIVDPEAHAAWVQRQIAAGVAQVRQEFDQRDQQRQQAEYERETKRLMAEAGVPVETLQAALAHVQQSQPWMVVGLNQAPNPFKAVIDYAKSTGFNVPGAAPVTPSSNDAIPDHIRQKVLADEAAKRAAASAPPQMTMPRGVGGAPSGAGFSDSLPPPSEYSKLSTAEYEAIKAKVLSQ